MESRRMPRVTLTATTIASLDDTHHRPYLIPDVQVARQYKHHLLVLPNEAEPRWTSTIAQALEIATSRGYNEVDLITEGHRLTIRT
jgi:hypothetical protein